MTLRRCIIVMGNFTDKQMKRACGGCPFKRVNDNEKPNPGGSHPFVYLGQARGPFWLPCHNDLKYDGKTSDPGEVKQCAGASVFRNNCGKKYRLPKQLIDLPADHQDVFSNEAEFYAHYSGMPIHDVQMLLTDERLDLFMRLELEKIEAQRLS